MTRRERQTGGPPDGESGQDFRDWDNPEDEDAAEDEDWYIPGPDDPDYDLSEAAGYANWEPPKREGPVPQWLLVTVSIILIIALLLPAFRLLS